VVKRGELCTSSPSLTLSTASGLRLPSYSLLANVEAQRVSVSPPHPIQPSKTDLFHIEMYSGNTTSSQCDIKSFIILSIISVTADIELFIPEDCWNNIEYSMIVHRDTMNAPL
jgi:hypothetical protein